MNEKLKASILDHINKMQREIKSLSLFVKTGIVVANKDEDLISQLRLASCQNYLGLAQASLNTTLHTVERYADKYANCKAASKDVERIVEELLALTTENLGLAKFSYAYHLEYRNNPDRSIEELIEAASKTEESLFI